VMIVAVSRYAITLAFDAEECCVMKHAVAWAGPAADTMPTGTPTGEASHG
jgi:hypothetical protein